jgi:hypothetical protein
MITSEELKVIELDIKKASDTFNARSKEFREGTFLCRFFESIGAPTEDKSFVQVDGQLINSIKRFFQQALEELDAAEIDISAQKEEFKALLRTYLQGTADKYSSDQWAVSMRRTHKYDIEFITSKAVEAGIDPETFYKVTKKFDPKLVHEDLKDAVADATTTLLSPTIKFKGDA